MNHRGSHALVAAGGYFSPLLLHGCDRAQQDEILKKADEAVQNHETSNLSDAKIIAGLKQALQFNAGRPSH